MTQSQTNFQTQANPIAEFAEFLAETGLMLDGDPIMDGNIHRVPVQDAKPGSLDGAYVGYLDGRPAGWAKNFKSGFESKWKVAGAKLSQQQVQAIMAQSRANHEKRNNQRQQDQKAALQKLNQFFKQSQPHMTQHHPYLKSKGLDRCDPAIRIGEHGELYIPIVNIKCQLRSAQRIFFTGNKRYCKSTSQKDNFFVAAPTGRELRDFWKDEPNQIFLTEGYATAQTISDALNHYTITAFDAHNLVSVGAKIREKYPNATLVFCADNDRHGAWNKGVALATEAAEKVNGILVIPQFPSNHDTGTDFNDLYMYHGGAENGLTAVRNQITAQITVHKNRDKNQQEQIPER